MPGVTAPIGKFDPLGYAQVGSEETLMWFRAAELKHSRVAMLATTGYLVQASGAHFPGQLSSDVSFDSLSAMKPFDAWEAVPDAGKAQIIGTIFVAELASEIKEVHYTKGGPLPTVVFPPIDFSGVNADTLKTKQNRELNNGRLAMIVSAIQLESFGTHSCNIHFCLSFPNLTYSLFKQAIMSFVAENNIPGSVPVLTGIDAF